VSGERISILESYSRPSGVTAFVSAISSLLLLTRSLLASQFAALRSLPFLFFPSRSSPLFVRVTAKEVFFNTATHQRNRNLLLFQSSIHKSLSLVYSRKYTSCYSGFFCVQRSSMSRAPWCRGCVLESEQVSLSARVAARYSFQELN